MFCGERIAPADLTMEHFVPKGLWEKGKRPEGMKTLPAHLLCNRAFAEDNEYFRDILAMEEGAQLNAAADAVQRGALQRKLHSRPRELSKTLKNARVGDVTTRGGIALGARPVFEVEQERLDRVLFNVMKGIFYVAQGEPLFSKAKSFVADLRRAPKTILSKIEAVAALMCPWQSFGDKAFACRYVISRRKSPEKMSCLMQFYENRVFYGEVVAPSYLEDVFVAVSEKSPILVPRWTRPD